MKIVCGRDELLRGMQAVQAAVSPKMTLPILGNVLVETEKNRVKLSSTDLEVGVRCYLKAEVLQEGAVTVPAKTFWEFIRTLQDHCPIEIEVREGQRMDIECGRSRCRLIGLPKEDFPVLPEFPEDRALTIERSRLREMLKKTAFSISTDETRYVLNGVYLITEPDQWIMVATDGRRLAYIARTKTSTEQGPGKDKKGRSGVIIPNKPVMELQRLLAGDEGHREAFVKVYIGENQIAFRVEETTLLSRLIEGHFPSYDQVIPKTFSIQVQVPTTPLLMMTQRAALGTIERGAAVRYSLTPGMLRVSASAQGRIEVQDEIDVQYQGDPLDVAFNPIFVMDILKHIDVEEVLLQLTSPLNPGVVRPVGDDQYIAVVMPMRVGE